MADENRALPSQEYIRFSNIFDEKYIYFFDQIRATLVSITYFFPNH